MAWFSGKWAFPLRERHGLLPSSPLGPPCDTDPELRALGWGREPTAPGRPTRRAAGPATWTLRPSRDSRSTSATRAGPDPRYKTSSAARTAPAAGSEREAPSATKSRGILAAVAHARGSPIGNSLKKSQTPGGRRGRAGGRFVIDAQVPHRSRAASTRTPRLGGPAGFHAGWSGMGASPVGTCGANSFKNCKTPKRIYQTHEASTSRSLTCTTPSTSLGGALEKLWILNCGLFLTPSPPSSRVTLSKFGPATPQGGPPASRPPPPPPPAGTRPPAARSLVPGPFGVQPAGVTPEHHTDVCEAQIQAMTSFSHLLFGLSRLF